MNEDKHTEEKSIFTYNNLFADYRYKTKSGIYGTFEDYLRIWNTINLDKNNQETEEQ